MDKTINFDLVSDLYDKYVNVNFDVDFYKKFCKGYDNILELMCGTGRVSLPLIKDGFNITCVDYSQGMLDEFRSKLANDCHEKILCQDVCELEIDETFDLVMIPFNSISEIVDREKRKKAIQRIYEHLKTGGVFLCTLYNPEYRKKTADGNLKSLGKYNIENNKTLIVSYYNNYSVSDSLLNGTQYYEIYDEANKLIEKRFMDIQCVLMSEIEITEMCEAAGFALKEIYGDYSFSPFTADSMFMNCVFVKK